jgi:hypothetical protein
MPLFERYLTLWVALCASALTVWRFSERECRTAAIRCMLRRNMRRVGSTSCPLLVSFCEAWLFHPRSFGNAGFGEGSCHSAARTLDAHSGA